jgi:hypothetical protein
MLAEREREDRGPHVIAALRLLALTACLSEIFTLRWDYVDFDADIMAARL